MWSASTMNGTVLMFVRRLRNIPIRQWQKRLKSIGFGTFQSSLANAIGGIVNDAVLNESRNLHKIFDEHLKKEIANANRAFDAEFAKNEKNITDAIEQYKAKAEEFGAKIHEEMEKERPELREANQ